MMLGSLRRDPAWLMLALGAVALLGYFLLWPVLSMLTSSLFNKEGQFGLHGYVQFFSEPAYRESLFNTLWLGGAVTVFSLVLGAGLALAAARFSFPLATCLGVLPLLTLVIPDVVVAAAWIVVLGKQGVLNSVLAPLGLELPSLYSWWGLVFVMTLNNYVYAYVAVLVGLKSMDRNLEEAGLSLGSSPARTLRTVTFPLMMPALCGAAVLVFMHVIGDFGVPAILGARTPVLAVKTYNEFVSEMGGNPQMQTTMASLLVFLGLALLLIQKWVVARRTYQMESGRAPERVPLRAWQAAVCASLVSILIVLSVLPVMVVVVTAFTPSIGPVLKYGGFTLSHMQQALVQAPGPLYNSLLLGAAATSAGAVFSIVAAYLIVKRPSGLSTGLDVLVMLPLTIAGTVLGIALINVFNSGWLVLTGSWVIMALAYFLRRVPTSVRAAMGPLHNLRSSIEEASISLGVAPMPTFAKVVLPVVWPAVIAATVLMWITTLSELSATVVLYFGGMSTLPIEVFQLVDSGRLAQASAYSLVLLMAIFLPLLLTRFIFKVKVGWTQ
ncbi:iron ABC transporter permease [Alcaligenes nematophilus]|uniref:Iron ABC transporter permease n=1 Tax=Alcaligenes nematophilus TaxID=2994643 RepID=A0ABU3MZQ5_9BURK|nr:MULTISPECIES: iron ABC transporter permease [Alcaligenes]MDT8465846.1 iron ABC transporter permease [Alcaligenes nematophilus]MDT8469079.1 iron ABC transporter permease [Alcaligenes nematophilus]MDT8505869.1 iron ABC transporter permease [Alcaligenes nematophilus]MDT8526517.1 iron ABC transporter permease [Alcaligenes nematophilus]QCP82667.1 iron ABC transporter permease [Alcaligenes faecalis]